MHRRPGARRRTAMAVLVALFCATMALAAQEAPAPPDRAAVVMAARAVMQKARYCSLVTLGAEGQLQARVVDPFAPDEAMTVWIGTNPATRKVAEVRNDPRATLICADAAEQAYVTLLGTARVVTDPAEKAMHWKSEWSGFYKDTHRGDDYVLLRFEPRRLEVVSPAHTLLNDPVTWRPVSIDLLAPGAQAAGAPTPASAAAPSSAEQFVRGIYTDVSASGGTLPDWNRVRDYFVKEAVVVLRTGRDQTTVFSLEGFLKDFADFYERPMKLGDEMIAPKTRGFTERVVRSRAWEYGDMAHVLVLYEAEIAGWNRPPQQGVDSWLLVRRDGRWRIAAATNEIVTAARPVPAELR